MSINFSHPSYFQIEIKQNYPTYFFSILHFNHLKVSAETFNFLYENSSTTDAGIYLQALIVEIILQSKKTHLKCPNVSKLPSLNCTKMISTLNATYHLIKWCLMGRWLPRYLNSRDNHLESKYS